MATTRETPPKGVKVLFLGLDNAGKSSIILTLLRDFSRIAILKPTRGVKQRIYDFLGIRDQIQSRSLL